MLLFLYYRALFAHLYASDKNFARSDLSDQFFFGKLWIVLFIRHHVPMFLVELIYYIFYVLGQFVYAKFI